MVIDTVVVIGFAEDGELTVDEGGQAVICIELQEGTIGQNITVSINTADVGSATGMSVIYIQRSYMCFILVM